MTSRTSLLYVVPIAASFGVILAQQSTPPPGRNETSPPQQKSAPKKTETTIQETVNDPRGRTPTKGEEVRTDSAVAETGGLGQSFGLSSSGSGAGSYLDTPNFCCPEYLAAMVDLIRQNWSSRQKSAGITIVKYTIQRDGSLTNIEVEKSSGYAVLDFVAQRSLQLTKKLPPLPAAFAEPSLTVHLLFEYQR